MISKMSVFALCWGCKPLAWGPSVPLLSTVLTDREEELRTGRARARTLHHSSLHPYFWLSKSFTLSSQLGVWGTFLFTNLRNLLEQSFVLDRGMRESRGRKGRWKSVKELNLAHPSAFLEPSDFRDSGMIASLRPRVCMEFEKLNGFLKKKKVETSRSRGNAGVAG